MLKAGIIEDYAFEETTEGSGQGSVCSPIIANIYMHYVLVWWFHEVMKPRMKEYCGIIVYADDFVVCFKSKEDAQVFYECLKKIMKHFGLELEEQKSRLIEFGRFAQERAQKRGTKAETFDFLGFTHYCSTSKNGKFQVKRKTSRKKFSKKCKEVRKTIKNMRTVPLAEVIDKLNIILIGYYHYYGINGNRKSVMNFRQETQKSLFYWTNRRSQRKSYTWRGFNEMLKVYPLAMPKTYVVI